MITLVTAPVAAFALGACGGDSGRQVDPLVSQNGGVIESVAINALSDTIAAGDSVKVNAVATANGGTKIANPQLQWQSSDTTVARVDTTGLIRTYSAGSFALTVTASQRGTAALAASTKTMFSKRTIMSVTLTRPAGSDTLPMADSVLVTAVAHDGLGAVFPGAQVTWVVSDTAAASVNASGLLRARGMGPVTVTANVVGPSDACAARYQGRPHSLCASR